MNSITETPVVRSVVSTIAETAAKAAALPMLERALSSATNVVPRWTDNLADLVVHGLGGSRTNRGYLGGSSFLAGLVVGGGAALLLTPMTGKDLREALMTNARSLFSKKDLSQKVEEVSSKVEEGVTKVESTATKLADGVKSTTHHETADARRLFRSVTDAIPPAKA